MARPRGSGSIAWPERYSTQSGVRYLVRYRDWNDGFRKRTAASDLPSKVACGTVIADLVAAYEKTLPETQYPGEPLDLVELARQYCKAKARGGTHAKGRDHEYPRRMATIQQATGWRTARDCTPQAISRWRQDFPSEGNWRILRAILRWGWWELDQPVDPRILETTPRSDARKKGKPQPRLLLDDQVRQVIAKATELGDHALAAVHFIASYGKRPITVMHLQPEDFDLAGSQMFIRHTKAKRGPVAEPYWHSITERTVAIMRPILEVKPPPGRRLLCAPSTGEPWPIADNGGATPFSNWYRYWIARPLGFETQHHGPYTLKDWGIEKMLEAGIPRSDIRLFSGTDNLERYEATHQARTRSHLEKLPGMDFQ